MHGNHEDNVMAKSLSKYDLSKYHINHITTIDLETLKKVIIFVKSNPIQGWVYFRLCQNRANANLCGVRDCDRFRLMLGRLHLVLKLFHLEQEVALIRRNIYKIHRNKPRSSPNQSWPKLNVDPPKPKHELDPKPSHVSKSRHEPKLTQMTPTRPNPISPNMSQTQNPSEYQNLRMSPT